MEKFFEAVSHKNTRPLDFSYRKTLSRGKTKQTIEPKNPEARDHCKHLYVQILSLSKFECHSSLQISCESQILLKLQLLVSVSVNLDTISTGFLSAGLRSARKAEELRYRS